tara:strand:+ start:290 stop:559 length:270 start_codon:yes stop_codon:yes gene_type:complete
MAETPIKSPLWDANKPIVSMPSSEAYRESYDKIFRKGEEAIEAMKECTPCRGKGYHVERESEMMYGRSVTHSYRVPCACCDGTGKRKEK